MRDFVWVLKHQTNKLTKTWNADGTISNYDDPKLFIGSEVSVSSIKELSDMLSKMENDPNSCLIRGKYKGYEHSITVEPDDSKKGRVLRRKSVHDDVKHHWLLVDIDNFTPVDAEPMLDPVGAIEEFITSKLPNCFHGMSYHWQLSSSAGHPSKDHAKLKAHVWFWLKTPYLSTTLRTWANKVGYAGDKALFDTIQVHYTATPVFEDKTMNPFRVRSGYVSGDFGDNVHLIIDESIIAEAGDGSAPASRHQKLSGVWSSDPVIVMLQEKRMVKSKRPDGGLNIQCPRHEHHTGDSGESSSIYYAAYTGGHKHGSFVCLHEHCRGVAQSIFLEALGYDDAADVFSDLTAGDDIREKSIPAAKHLCTDQANAERIIKSFRQRIMVVADRWFAYDGSRWKADDGEAIIKGMNLSRIITKEADKWRAQANDSKRYVSMDEKAKLMKIAEALDKWSQKSEMSGTINAAMGLAKKVLTIEADQVDSNPWLINFTNGTVDIRTMTRKPHDPKDYITKVAGCAYHPEKTCQMFETVMDRVFMETSSKVKPIVGFMRRWFGYCMTGSTREQKFVIHYGNGRNGKSTILDAVADVLGEYSGVAAPGLMLTADRGRHPTEIADLFGRRMVTAHETGENGVMREDFIKQATGGDKMKARYMNKDFFEFNPTHKLQMLTNHKPIIKGQDDGIWRRVAMVPYVAKFGTPEEVESGAANYVRDTRIAEVIATEREGIAAFLVEGAYEWYRDGLNPPDTVIAASKAYQKEQDRVSQFIQEVCETGKELECYLTNGDGFGSYPAYQRWCRESGIHSVSKVNFLTSLERVVPFFTTSEKLIKTHAGRRRVTVLSGFSCPEAHEI